MNDLIALLSASSLNSFITSTIWVWPVMEMIHFLGLCLLFGSLLLIDLRLLGFAPSVSPLSVERFLMFSVLGFAMNLVTGVLFLIGDPGRYLVNIAFQLKMLLILLAGLNALMYPLAIKPKLLAGMNSADLSTGLRCVAALSLLFWTCVIILGRMIPYVEDL